MLEFQLEYIDLLPFVAFLLSKNDMHVDELVQQ